ncbi:hypothetical protein GWI33_000721 [Rhynchophorus ferrugineus]|uniref:Uncharacterized protein n=1 Tax=Rhynchophorus ferrugineus TaxID=354439 RepID=A0A834IT59_RHYFE|nr:hypothetical protein GWI33_000721 [Rhynchophorus ferrugineus]
MNHQTDYSQSKKQRAPSPTRKQTIPIYSIFKTVRQHIGREKRRPFWCRGEELGQAVEASREAGLDAVEVGGADFGRPMTPFLVQIYGRMNGETGRLETDRRRHCIDGRLFTIVLSTCRFGSWFIKTVFMATPTVSKQFTCCTSNDIVNIRYI